MKKALLIALGILLLILAVLVSIPFLFKGKIVALVKEQSNQQVNATINFNEDIQLSIFKSFPNLSLSIRDLSIIGIGEFKGDTLLSMKELNATIDIMSVISGDAISIRKILLDEPNINVVVLSNGKANYDIAKPTSDTAQTEQKASPFHIKLKSFEIKHANIVYDDRQGSMYNAIEDLNYTLTGDFSDQLFDMQNKLDIAALTFRMGSLTYLKKVHTTAQAVIEADMPHMKFVFKDNTFGLNALVLKMDGSFEMPDTNMKMDLKFALIQSEFKSILSLIPAIYTQSFSDLQSKGTLAFNGYVKGVYNGSNMPGFGLNLSIDNGWFKYPVLPVPVEDVNVRLNVANPDGVPDHTLIDLQKLHASIAGDAFDARMTASTPISDPFVDASLKGKILLERISKFVPLEKGMELSGIIQADVTAKGHVKAIEQQKYDQFQANGFIKCESIHYKGSQIPDAVNISLASLSFSPQLVALTAFDATAGKSDMHMNGKLENFFPYYFGKGVLMGQLNFSSKVLNANSFLTDDTTKKAADTAALVAFEVPATIDFTLNSSIDQLNYSNLEIHQFKGTVKIADEKVNLQNIALETLGSKMKLNGYYETTHPKKPTVMMDLAIAGLDIQKAFKTFNTVKKLAPVAEHVNGSVSTTFKLNSNLDMHMNPVYPSLFAQGTLDIANGQITNLDVMNKIADLIGKPEYKQVTLQQTHIAFKVDSGRVHTQPFDVKIGKQKLTLSGSSGFDQTLDYKGNTQIPRKDLGSANTAIEGALALLNKQAGTDVALNEMIPIGIKIGGTFTHPTIKTDMSDFAKTEANSLKDQALKAAAQKKKQLEDQAKAEAEKLKADAIAKAKAQADQIKNDAESKAKAEAARLKSDAEAKAKAEADNLKKQAEEEAKKKLKNFFKKE